MAQPPAKKKWNLNPTAQIQQKIKQQKLHFKEKTKETIHQIKQQFQDQPHQQTISQSNQHLQDTPTTTQQQEIAVQVLEHPEVRSNDNKHPHQHPTQYPLWIEILAARNLLSADPTGKSDPYVKVKFKGHHLHQTKPILQTLNPIYGPNTNHSFLFQPTDYDYDYDYDNDSILFKVKDWDALGKNDELGQVQVPIYKLYSSQQDIDFHLLPPKGKESLNPGTLTIRCRPATDQEQHQQQQQADTPNTSIRDYLPPIPVRQTQPKQNDETPLLSFFIEILSCRDLIPADKTGFSDPYVKIKLRGKDLHQTEPRRQTLNPKYTEDMNSTFVLDVNEQDLQQAEGLVFKIKDWDRLGTNDELGHATLSSQLLITSNGQDMELPIVPPKGHEVEYAGFITIRCRPATHDDRTKPKPGLLQRLGGRTSSRTKNTEEQTPAIHDLALLIEIVSCWGLPKADRKSTDPMVVVYLRDNNIHQTKPIFKTLDPIYTVETDALFILDANTEALKNAGGLIFSVKDYDSGVMRNDAVCSVKVPAETLLEAKGERLEFELNPAAWVVGDDAGRIAIRCRPVTAYDREFMAHVKSQGSRFFSFKRKKSDFLGIEEGYDQLMKTAGGKISAKDLLKKNRKTEDGIVKYRIRPQPDPARPKATKYMSEKEIEAETQKESRSWLDVGSGNLGKVFLEILAADNLPNKDVSVSANNKTDAFVSIVYEDCAVRTDIVADCLSPRWLPWMQRAFIFRMMHSSSNLHLAVFDHDSGSTHDFCGRVSIDLSNLRTDTEYRLTYNLYESSHENYRQPQGTVTVRLRMELENERSRMLSSLGKPPVVHFNVRSAKEFEMIRQTVQGKYNVKSYDKKTIQMYVDELLSHQYVKFIIDDALVSLLFWRGQVRLCREFWIPLYSFVVFIAAIALAEFPWLFPSLLCFGLSWILLAVQTRRNNSPNPWDQTKPFYRLFAALVLGSTFTGPHSIEANKYEKESNEYEAVIQQRIQEAKDDAEKLLKEEEKLLEEYRQKMSSLGEIDVNTDIATSSDKVSLDPFKPVLYPIQKLLGKVCTSLRLAKNVLLWNEPYYAFFFTFALMLSGMVFLVIPWGLLLKWAGRIVAWGLFGPHMKLVDWCWYSRIDRSDETRSLRLKEEYNARLEQAQGTAALAREQREETLKLQAMKKLLFGKYITNIPILRLERYVDTPLHTSFAKPCQISKSPLATLGNNVVRLHGQQLVGIQNMIPKILGDEQEQTTQDLENGNGSKTSEVNVLAGPNEKTPLITHEEVGADFPASE